MDREWKWCARWWLHVEAVVRLEATRKAWEVLRLDPGTGASVWLRDHAHPAVTALTKPHGTFHRCGPTEHAVYDSLPVDERPPACSELAVVAGQPEWPCCRLVCVAACVVLGGPAWRLATGNMARATSAGAGCCGC
jgi:hypothetical protein